MKKASRVLLALAAVLTVFAPFLANQAGACSYIAGQTPIPDALRK